MPSDYVPPRLNTAKRFHEMQEKAGVAGEKKSTAPAKPKSDAKDERIKAAAKSMDKLSVDALIRRAQAAAGGN